MGWDDRYRNRNWSLERDSDPRPLPYQPAREETFDGFDEWVRKRTVEKNARIIVAYAKRYAHILKGDNANELLALSDSRRHKVMEALSSLSKYLGCYDRWREIRERYQLKWSNEDSLQIFNSLFNAGRNYNAMLNWLKDTCSKLPSSYRNALIFDTLTGLRPDETCQSISLIKNDFDNYLNRNSMILEHYKYPDIFIRRTKKAFVSIVTDSVLEVAKGADDQGYNALRLAVKRRGLDMHMAYCRKIFATYLRDNGIPSEVIDLLQGRIPKSVFGRHYYRPDFEDYAARVRQLLKDLHHQITT